MVGVFECPKCLTPIAHLPRYQSEIYARYQEVCDLGDFLFAATATGSGLKARQAALLDQIRDTTLLASSASNLLRQTCCRILESFARAIDSKPKAATTTSTTLTSRELGLLETKAAILSVLQDVVNSKDDDKNSSTWWVLLCEQIAACGAISRPMVTAALGGLLRTRGGVAAAERLNAELVIWSYERELWKRCAACRGFYQGPSCRSCSRQS
jgi:hypothetical protein